MPRTCLLIIFLFFACIPSLGAQDSAILEPVRIFDKYYGTSAMDRVAEVVTSEFRAGKPGSTWVSETWKLLDEIEYQRLASQIKNKAVEGDRALVRVHVTIETVAGRTEQDEIYHLVRDGGRWLIDDLQVHNEDVEAEKKEL